MATKEIIAVSVEDINDDKNDVLKQAQQRFEDGCAQGDFYQLEVPDLELLTSMDSCYYSKVIGLNDTLSFATNADTSALTSMSVQVKDLKYLASFERSPKKKRLMQERQFDKFVGTAVLSKMLEGAKPEFNMIGYDALGQPVKSPEEAKKEEAAKEEGEKSFFQKYWMYIVMGMLVMNTLGAVAGDEEGGQRGGGGGGRRAAK